MSESEGPCILITGGCGYIGSHTLTTLLNDPRKFSLVVVDNLVNSSMESLDRVAQICNLNEEEAKRRLVFRQVDICDEVALRKVFEESPKITACIHFAGLKAVGESVDLPLMYYQNNLVGTFTLLSVMEDFGCRTLVFSSSATVYGKQETMPITESSVVGLGITNAYGRTKYMVEEVLRDFYRSSKEAVEYAKSSSESAVPGRVRKFSAAEEWSITILRYFNPVGSHPSGLIGEDPSGIPNNLMPYVGQVAVGRRDFLTVFGTDYDTPDGTGVRDYIHVMDLAQGHLSAIDYMLEKKGGIWTFNLGTGNGYSVLDMVKAMEKASGREIKYMEGPRRSGDIATCYADSSLAKTEMGWEAKLGLDEMCRDLWCWQEKNPNGFAGGKKRNRDE
uniref:UDP-glucose 4-epimerase n=1 Tax=Odontella aurita TaxID=265563 RepID=A0A7S4MX38_9STRA|mmetsp:Transcript_37594/g.112694  ORF Transcript_37594/g.112694 Transcript_37594/m.112694 type:complete len:390 (+) Transcript_37594:283-1452(+)|eukprot:CAMPEP_0113566326 /NCGR_PEP_ID=MMETSP0015_2-20120614/22662_1 /TAXON_ID=2838 /ORGANISM="Odontella" /LENGTH=389 /DNA_ID=CAMNT_0000468605 /DNA_START=160 /DNA_END=1329 /DNA_ORIENTATION=+ /assembly_acc=CAM_ASM_000160